MPPSDLAKLFVRKADQDTYVLDKLVSEEDAADGSEKTYNNE
jgi:hypothetical protein